MTISDFLKLPNFSDLRLLAGWDGISNIVTNVTVVDTPDGTNWLDGGELVITTAYMLHEEKDLLEFLRTLSSRAAPTFDLCSGSLPICRYYQSGTDPDHQPAVISSDPGKHDPQGIFRTCH